MGKIFFERVSVETGKWGVDRYATGLEPEHMVNPFYKNRWWYVYDQNMLWKWCIFVYDWISDTKYFLPMRNLWITIILDYRIPFLTLFQLYRDC